SSRDPVHDGILAHEWQEKSGALRHPHQSRGSLLKASMRRHWAGVTGMTESRGRRTSSQSENSGSCLIAVNVTGLGKARSGTTTITTPLGSESLGSGSA